MEGAVDMGSTCRNLLSIREYVPGALPKTMAKRNRREREYLAVLHTVHRYYRRKPEERMLVWLPLWRGATASKTSTARINFRSTFMIDLDRYLISQRDCYLWFTMVPPEEEMTVEQAQGLKHYRATAPGRPRDPNATGSYASRRKQPPPMPEGIRRYNERRKADAEREREAVRLKVHHVLSAGDTTCDTELLDGNGEGCGTPEPPVLPGRDDGSS